MARKLIANIVLLLFANCFCMQLVFALPIPVDYLVSDAAIGKFHGVLRLTHSGQDPKTLNPWISTDATSSFYAGLLFDGLMTSDPNTDEPLPQLAKSYKITNGGKRIEVTLRRGLSWSDGRKISADDVVYTWNTLIRDGVAQSSLKDILLVEGKFPKVTKLDDYTIVFETEKVFAPFLKNLSVPIAPKHDVERFLAGFVTAREGKLQQQNHKVQSQGSYGEIKSQEQSSSPRRQLSLADKQALFNRYLATTTNPQAIISSGPFKLLRIKSGERIEFMRNANYYIVNKANQRLPYVDRVVFTYVQDDAADTFKFLAGESYELKVSPNNAALIKSLEEKYKFKLYDLGPSSGTNFMWFNMSSSMPLPQRLWFNSKEFRTAVSYAIDRDSMVANVYQGLAAPLFTAESLQSPFVDTKLGHKRDLKYARSLLLAAGFYFAAHCGAKHENAALSSSGKSSRIPNSVRSNTMPERKSLAAGTILQQGSKQILCDSAGHAVEFDLFTNAGNREREMMASIIAANLEDIGIKVHVKTLEFNNFVARLNAGKNYEAGLIGLTGSSEPNGGANVWRSDGRLHIFDQGSGSRAKPRAWESEIDRLFSEGVGTVDFNQRKAIYTKFQELVYRENPMVFLVSPRILVAGSNKLGNLKPSRYQGLMPFLHEIFLK